jgi:hypothetical protein
MKSLYTNLFISTWTRLLHTQMYHDFKFWPRYDHFTKSSHLIVEKFRKSYLSHTHFITHTSIILPIFVSVLLHCTYLAVVDCCVVWVLGGTCIGWYSPPIHNVNHFTPPPNQSTIAIRCCHHQRKNGHGIRSRISSTMNVRFSRHIYWLIVILLHTISSGH